MDIQEIMEDYFIIDDNIKFTKIIFYKFIYIFYDVSLYNLLILILINSYI